LHLFLLIFDFTYFHAIFVVNFYLLLLYIYFFLMYVCAAPTCSHQSVDGSSYYVDVDVDVWITLTVSWRFIWRNREKSVQILYRFFSISPDKTSRYCVWIYTGIYFVLLNISSKFLLHLECYLLSPKRHIKIIK
jgi:hypothetical protein